MYELPLKRGYRGSVVNSNTGENITALSKSWYVLQTYGLWAHVTPRGSCTPKVGHQA